MKYTGGIVDYCSKKSGPFTGGAAYCRAKKTMKLPNSLASENFGLEKAPLRGFKCAYRCITCNGNDTFPIYRFELGLFLPSRAIDHRLSRQEISTCIERFLRLSVRVPKSRQPNSEEVGFHAEREMFKAGDLISAHILGATSPDGGSGLSSWVMDVGAQWVLVQLEATEVEQDALDSPVRDLIREVVALPEVGLSLYHFRPDCAPYSPHAYVILRRHPDRDHDALNRLRDYTIRMHVEHEALQSLLRLINSSDLKDLDPDDPRVLSLGRLLESKVRSLSRKKRFGFEQDELLSRLLASDAPFSADRYQEIRKRLKDVKAGLAVTLISMLRRSEQPPPDYVGESGELVTAEQKTSGKVFIGHGGSSLVWMQLKDYIEGQLKLDHEEFNRVSQAGKFSGSRIAEMLDNSEFAFLVMTAEDEAEGKLRARQNVIHEAGLFQGRIGFDRAIVLLEDGCEDFSNIHGLTHIPFPKGNITAAFHEVRAVLAREGLVDL
ncbi:nucleotide-binding protein [Streptomyces rhizosphaerihabitans]|uniref:nucleotide-binding protein n=1 Tax=Streptomyces rhizosphaerihabitans TaxID=1266770 RepID=UPI0021BE8AAE|nr:nucleotide-binding protein [Streptomyces rhizosphaerihabitans]MCT9011626.1 nucleotide-binding protein [Streptomyces rhizosphaerihabitans]